ncbi:acyltransferase family protein [Pseudomonas sp. Z2-11]
MIKNIQYLRFFAAFLVVLAHSHLQIYGVDARETNLGGFGVDIFFIISGFIMPFIIFGGLYTPTSTATMGAGGFMWRRFTRIWPMYFLTIMMVVFLSWLVSSGWIEHPTKDFEYFFNRYRMDPKWLLQTLSFTHWDRPPVLGIGWTLQVEFLFYAAIAVTLILRARSLEAIESGLLAFFFIILILSTWSPIASSFSNAMIVEFMLGMFLYRVISKGALIPKSLAVGVVLMTLPAFLIIEYQGLVKLAGSLYRPIAWGLPAFFLVWAALSLEDATPRIRWLELLGDASYSLYLVHGFVAPVFVYIWVSNGLVPVVPAWIYLGLYLTACQIAGIAAHLFIEKPITRAIRNLTRLQS